MLSLVRFAHSWRVDGLVAVTALGLGIVAFRFRPFRTAATGWRAASAPLVLGGGAYLVVKAVG